MRRSSLLLLLLNSWIAGAAPFGTAVSVIGGATDLALDEARGRLYIVNNTQNRVDVYSTAQRRYLNSISVGNAPLSAAVSADNKYLYVTAYDSSSLDIVDLDAAVLATRVSLPAAPEGVAVGGDGRVLITTVGSGTNNADNRLLLFTPQAAGTPGALRAIPTTLPAPAIPQVPAPSSRVFMSTRSNLAASRDGKWIVGLNNPNTTSRQLFVYEVSSASILRSRTVTSISNVLSVSSDGSRFMAGLSLFDSATLALIAQQNTANALQPFANNTNFSTQQNQGGSVFAPDGSVLYAAFNVAPVQNPVAAANITQLMYNDPDNLLIKLTLQLPENLTGNMVISSDGGSIYALSQSGFLTIPVSAVKDSPLASIDNPVVLLANDQCGVTSSMRTVDVHVSNAGKGRLTATAQVMQNGGVTFTFPIGGTGGGVIGGGGAGGGAGGGFPGGGFPIILPPGFGGIGGGQIQIPPGTAPGRGAAATAAQQTGVTQNAPTVTTRRTDTDTVFTFTFNSNATRSLGTIAPTDFLIQSAEAINVPARVRVYQNNRNSEARGTVMPVPVSISTAEGLMDMVADGPRQRLYIANSGLNRVEVFDMRTNQFLAPVKVGQLPHSLAMTPSGAILYVANSGGESISIIDLEKLEVTGSVKFPAVPYNAGFALITPSVIASTLSGLQIVMSDGTLWKVVDNEALPRKSTVIGTTALTAPRTMAAAPGGEYAILLAGNGTAYLFDAMADDFVLSQSVVTTPIQGYFGPLAAGPRGQYFVVNGTVLNASLTPIRASGVPVSTRPVAAVAAVSATMVARYTLPVLATANAAVRDTPTVELLDAATGIPRGSSPALEGPLSTQVGTQRVNLNGRTMAIDAAGANAYVLSATGLSVVPLTQTVAQPGGGGGFGGGAGGGGAGGGAGASTAVRISSGGVVNSASYQPGLAPGSVISIFGQNLASDATASSTPWPRLLGGACVTLDEVPLPLMASSAGMINAQLPPDTKTGSHALVVRAPDRNLASNSQTITVAKYAPAVYMDPDTGQAAVYHADGSDVNKSRRAQRDEALVLYATGLGATHGGTVTAGNPSPTDPLAVTDKVQVFFGDARYSQAEIIVDWGGLVPGFVGLYQLNLRVPGDHMKGDALLVTLRIGGINSPTTGNVVPTVAVE